MAELWQWIETLQWPGKAWLWLGLVPLGLMLWQWLGHPLGQAALPVPGAADWRAGGGVRPWLRRLLPWLRLALLGCLLLALARPRQAQGEERIKTDAIDIMLSLDLSTSMDAMDFQPNRLEAAKQTAATFIDNRENDRIGLVVFSAQAFTQCPLTNDHRVLKLLLKRLESGLIENGTAIGLGLANAVLRLKDGEAASKVIILLTDGVNNRFEVNPQDAIQLAQQFGIRVYTIGVGTNGLAPVPKTDFAGNRVIVEEPVEIDEELLKLIAAETGGRYFRATDNEGLKQVYEEIDRLETTEIEVVRFTRYEEWYWPLALMALVLLALEILLRYGPLRSLPE